MRIKASRIHFVLFLLLILLFSLSLIVIKQKNSYDIRSRASVEDDVKYCVNAPECCARIDVTHDAHECDWPIRGYCRNCGSIDGKNERCGWYWIFHNANDNEYKLGTNSPDGYGCMIGDEGNMRPKYNADGTINKLQPTAIPTTIPTQKPTSIPPTTVIPQPTKKIIQPTQSKPQVPFPTAVVQPKVVNIFESPTPTPIPFKINFGIPAIQIDLININKNVKKPLEFFQFIFKTIRKYDLLLETTINTRIKELFKQPL